MAIQLVTQTQTTQQINCLGDILKTYREETDPLSERIRMWAVESYTAQNIPQHLQKLEKEVLVDSLYGKPLMEVPYLIDGKNVLPLRLFDEVIHTAGQLGDRSSPFDPGYLMAPREKVHQFALAMLIWLKRPIEDPASLKSAVPFEEALVLRMRRSAHKTLAAERNLLAISVKTEQQHKGNATSHRAQLAQFLEDRNALSETLGKELLTHIEELYHTLDTERAAWKERIRELQEHIQAAHTKIGELEVRVGKTEAQIEENRQRIVELERQIALAREELARIQTQLDGDHGGCQIL